MSHSLPLVNQQEDFQYAPLNKDMQEIRLVCFADVEIEDITFRIACFPLEQAPQFTALSYMWGAPDKVFPVIVSGKSLKVTKSLEYFFRAAASRHVKAAEPSGWPSGWLWIDAICINQGDQSERSEQVQMMKEIYERASNIVIWLGEDFEGSDKAMGLLAEIATLKVDDPVMSDGSIAEYSCRLGNAENFIEIWYEMLVPVSKLLNLPFWDRVWILQEVSTPKNSDMEPKNHDATWVCCGSTTISWKAYAEANRRLISASWADVTPQHIDLHAISNTNVSTVAYVEERRRGVKFQNSLYTVLVQSRTSNATDPRDKLYGILGLADERDDPGLQPDYTLSVEEVYTRLAKTIITRTQSLDCLGSAGLERNHKVPSWVPDWTVQHDRTPQPFYQIEQSWNRDGTIEEQSNLFNASGDVVPEINFEAKNYLIARGFSFDKVENVSMPRLWPEEMSDVRWQSWVSTASPDDTTYIGGGSRFEAYKKVLKGDYGDTWGDWSAERGGDIDGLSDPTVNAFELHDGIVNAVTWHRRLFTTSRGYMGVASATTEPGDVVCILFGSQMPLVLRKEGELWSFVGQAYIHGIMDGEATAGIDSDNCTQVFRIS